MKLSPSGLHVLGGIDATVHVDGAVPPAFQALRAGVWGFLDEGRAAGPVDLTNQGRRLYRYDLASGAMTPITEGVMAATDGFLALNDFGAGGGQWWAGVRPSNALSSVYSSALAAPLVGAALYQTPGDAGYAMVSREGLAVVRPDYRVPYWAYDVYDATGTKVTSGYGRPLACNDWFLVVETPAGIVVFDARNNWKARMVATLGTPEAVARAGDGEPYVLTWQEATKRTLLHHAERADGWIVAYGDHDFQADMGCLPDGTMRVVSSYLAGERPGDLRSELRSIAAVTVDLRPPSTPAPPPPPPPVDPPAPPPVPPAPPKEPIHMDAPTSFDYRKISPEGGTDPRSFARTSRMLDCHMDRGGLTTRHEKTGVWPGQAVGPTEENPQSPNFGKPTLVEGNQWLYRWIDGQWVAACNEWVRPGQTTKVDVTWDVWTNPDPTFFLFYDRNRWPRAFGWLLRAGEVFGVNCTTPARNGVVTSPQERSNVVFLRANADGTTTIVADELTLPTSDAPAPPVDPPQPPPVDPPPAPPVDPNPPVDPTDPEFDETLRALLESFAQAKTEIEDLKKQAEATKAQIASVMETVKNMSFSASVTIFGREYVIPIKRRN